MKPWEMMRRFGGAPAAASSFIAFDPLKTNVNVALSSANLRASTNAQPHCKAFCTSPKNTGKWQFEMTVVQSGGDVSIGITSSYASFQDTDYPYPTGSGGGGTFWSRVSGSYSRIYNGGTYSSPSPLAIAKDGDIVTICVDFDSKTMLVKLNNVAVGTGLYSISSIDPLSFMYTPFAGLWGSYSRACIVDINAILQYPEDGYAQW